MKIAFLSTFYGQNLGGAENSIDLLFQAINEQENCEVKVFTTRKYLNFDNVKYLPGTSFLPRKLLLLGNRILDLYLAGRIKKVLKHEDYDLIHVQDLYLLPAALVVGEKMDIPVIATVRDPLPKKLQDGDYNIILSGLINLFLHFRNKVWLKSLQKCHKVIAISNFIQRNLEKNSLQKEKISIVYNLPPNWISKDINNKETNDLKEKEKINILTAGRISKEKGIDVLLRALPELKNKNYKLNILGEGPYLDEIEKQINELNLKNYVELKGKVSFSEMSDFYVKSEVFICPSTFEEPFGRVVLEAQMLGKPVVASRVGGIPEILEDNYGGYLFTKNDYKALAKKLDKLLADKALRSNMGRQAKESVTRQFDKKIILNNLVNLYFQIKKDNKNQGEW